MAKVRSGETDINSYTLKGTKNIIRDPTKPQYVACVEKFEKDSSNKVNVHVRWYIRPEEAIGGRRDFHGANELFLSDHYDVVSAGAIKGKCVVHPFDNYTKLENPDFMQETPFNLCRYHPACVGLTIEEAKTLDYFLCSDCSSNTKEEVDESTLTYEEHNGKSKEPTQVPTIMNPNLEIMEEMCGHENQAPDCSTQNSFNNTETQVNSSKRVINVLNNMDGLESGSTLWCQALYLLEDPTRREIFLEIKDDASRLAWIKFRCNIKAN
ncbi:unnamed protein product [Lupinus luteus]|uniref:BAH domain-containing protein n=1 Tax=Lupinus luteus TaxID=3873 RepID=A0AAV1WM72_LUPLU